jgi:stearoyl-CoA desaturase (delta-9 desaturase)
LIKGWVGKDATAVFNGGVYTHSNAAHNLLSMIRVGVLRGGQEVEVWKEERETLVKNKMGQMAVRANDHITNVRPLLATANAA